ncbi:DEAD/DEAH box helicase family protein [Psychroflexus aestuariivivens]|uniref:DEAD/DEAH box helicase family protein n=1 Tax=Psychroflexus aestuariivivens TaxID=1795040 RepID=UPI000FD79FE7|nr:DEAD/DEAH box helicase family protein [Psychroflexus aestuariivivens]
MTSNFSFLASTFQELYNLAHTAEEKARYESRTSLFYARMSLEMAINWMYSNDHELEKPYDTSLFNLMQQPEFKAQFNQQLYSDLHIVRKLGNLASHNKPVNEADALTVIEKLFLFLKWFGKAYSDREISIAKAFDWEIIPNKEETKISKRQLENLQNKLEKQHQEYQKYLAEAEEKKEKLLEDNQLYKLQLQQQQKAFKANKEEANTEDKTHHPRDEKQTRELLIDVMLREAGWDLQGANDKEYKVIHMPKSTNPSGLGYVDYVLWDDNGKPLALLEAKKAMENVQSGENQAQLYADALELMHGQRPVMYYSNGYETYLWDDQFYKAARQVHGVYTKNELQTLMYRRNNRKDIRKLKIDTEIAGRSYQMRAIKSIAEHITGNDKATDKLIGTNRAALLVLATGTGKTRTSIAFSKLLLEANWAKRILFLADRVSLVKQAKSNFTKLLPDHSCVNLIEEKDNPDARIAFSTYQTLIGLIDGSRDQEKRFYGVGHFDLIIIDEAHRSIYQKYQAIFEYFDTLLLGLTATPKETIDHNTYKVFGLPDKSPTDAYSFEEAVKENYLTPYRSIEVPTKFLTTGIKYEDLSEEEQEEFESEILNGEEATGNEWIPENQLNDWLFNVDTTVKTLNYILKHAIKKRGGDEIGKTIIFARNRKHAQFLKDMLLEMDKQQFGNDYVKVITHGEPKAQEFIERFCDEEKDRLPQIAISVDMMDTGIDAPSCVNLLFYKPVKSYAKFWQMIGRGSRLRPDLFGPGKDKDKFLIFDLFGNFEFFSENPKGINSSVQKSITEQVFHIKLQLSEYLKQNHFQKDPELKQFRENLLDSLHQSVVNLDQSRFDVRMHLKEVIQFGENNRAVWNYLSETEIKTIKDTIAPLIQPVQGENDLARFYDKLIYSLMIKRMEIPESAQFKEQLNIPISKVAALSQKLLKKTSIPAVKQKEHIIQLPLNEYFWLNDGLKHLEKIRTNIRDLLVYIDKEDQRYVTTNFEDSFDELQVKIKDFGVNDEGEEYKTPTPFTNNIKRLEKIIQDNKDNIVISRIRNGEPITDEEIKSLENILFKNKQEKEKLEKALGSKIDIKTLIVSLLGFSPKKVDQAFANFINEYELNSEQIKFVETLKSFFTSNGKINPEKLYEAPFKEFHSQGVDGVFSEDQADNIFEIVSSLNEGNKGA